MPKGFIPAAEASVLKSVSVTTARRVAVLGHAGPAVVYSLFTDLLKFNAGQGREAHSTGRLAQSGDPIVVPMAYGQPEALPFK